jgi:hypothetical protein
MKLKAKISFTRCPIGKWEREKEITKDQLSILRRLFKEMKGTRVTGEQNANLTNIYNEIFGTRKKKSNCGGCVRELVNELKQILESYED